MRSQFFEPAIAKDTKNGSKNRIAEKSGVRRGNDSCFEFRNVRDKREFEKSGFHCIERKKCFEGIEEIFQVFFDDIFQS